MVTFKSAYSLYAVLGVSCKICHLIRLFCLNNCTWEQGQVPGDYEKHHMIPTCNFKGFPLGWKKLKTILKGTAQYTQSYSLTVLIHRTTHIVYISHHPKTDIWLNLHFPQTLSTTSYLTFINIDTPMIPMTTGDDDIWGTSCGKLRKK